MTVILWACQAQLPECVTQTRQQMTKLMSDPDYKISVDLKGTIWCQGSVNGGEDEFNFFWDIYEKSNDDAEKTLALNSIGCIQNREILEKFIRMYDKVEGDDWIKIFEAVSDYSPVGIDVLIEFLWNEMATVKPL
jgi:aminopeptidase N